MYSVEWRSKMGASTRFSEWIPLLLDVSKDVAEEVCNTSRELAVEFFDPDADDQYRVVAVAESTAQNKQWVPGQLRRMFN